MLDHIEGRVFASEATRLVVSVGGEQGSLAYQCRVPFGTADRLERRGEIVRVHLLTCVQDDCPRLLGFATGEERDLCRRLLSVAGVGPNLALSLLSAFPPEAILRAIADEDLALLTSIKGVGAKTARRLCLELRERAALWLDTLGPRVPRPSAEDLLLSDTVLALCSLGFSRGEAVTRATRARTRRPEAGTEELVKAALRGR